MTLNELILKKIEETIELNTDSVIGEDGTIVCDYAQLRGALMGMFTTALRDYRREETHAEDCRSITDGLSCDCKPTDDKEVLSILKEKE